MDTVGSSKANSIPKGDGMFMETSSDLQMQLGAVTHLVQMLIIEILLTLNDYNNSSSSSTNNGGVKITRKCSSATGNV